MKLPQRIMNWDPLQALASHVGVRGVFLIIGLLAAATLISSVYYWHHRAYTPGTPEYAERVYNERAQQPGTPEYAERLKKQAEDEEIHKAAREEKAREAEARRLQKDLNDHVADCKALGDKPLSSFTPNELGRLKVCRADGLIPDSTIP
jgi:hypothetical protein